MPSLQAVCRCDCGRSRSRSRLLPPQLLYSLAALSLLHQGCALRQREARQQSPLQVTALVQATALGLHQHQALLH
eukprot:1256775-Prorocentrum_lima.AAC.1